MLKIYYLILLLITLFNNTIHAQNFEWARNIGNVNKDYGTSIISDYNGNTYSTGWFEGTVDFDPSNNTFNLTSNGKKDAFILKLDKNGLFVWACKIGGNSNEIGYSITLDSLNSLYITGWFRNKVDFNSGIDSFYLNSIGENDVFVLKLDRDGEFVWAKSFGGKFNDVGISLCIDTEENIILTGGYESDVDFNPDSGIFKLKSEGDMDVFILKLNKNGNFIWAKSFGGSSIDQGHSIVCDIYNNYYITGFFNKTISVNNNILISKGKKDIFILKFDSSGNNIWTKSIGGDMNELGTSIICSGLNDIIVTGYFEGEIVINPDHTLNSKGEEDIFVLKLNSNGDLLWSKEIGGKSKDVGYSLTHDNNNNIYISGEFKGIITFDNSFLINNNIYSNKYQNIFILKLDYNGDFLRFNTIASNSNKYFYIKNSINLSFDNDIYIIGGFEDIFDFDPGPDTFYLKSQGQTDAFILKLSQCPSTTATQTVSTCDSFTWIDGNTYFDNNDITTYTMVNAAGCDSIITLDLTINHKDSIVDAVTTCNEYIWNGDTLRNSGIFTFDTLNTKGCDSITILNLTINKSTKFEIVETVCDSYIWKEDTINVSGIYQFDTLNTLGCDSIVTLNLTINTSSKTTLEKSACESYTWHDSVYTVSGIYYFDTLNISGCDSIVSLDLKIVDIIEKLDTMYICQGDTLEIFDDEIWQNKLVSKTFSSSAGCDSIQNIQVLVEPLPQGTISKSICEGDSVFVIDRWFSQEGEYDIHKENTDMCDSLYRVIIEKRPVFTTYDTISICQGDTIEVFDFEVYKETDLEQGFVGSNDCDSTVYIHVDILQLTSSQSQITLCPDDSMSIAGQWVNSTGIYQEIFTGSNGCDSISNIEVTVLETPEEPQMEIDCEEANVVVKVTNFNNPSWSVLWSNGDTTKSTIYKFNQNANVVFSTPSDCRVSYDFTVPTMPDLSRIPVINDTTVEAGSILTYQIELDSNLWDLSWSSSANLDCDTCTTLKIQVEEFTTIRLTMTHKSGCIYEINFDINIREPQLYIPDIFTPDGDGINDNWYISTPKGLKISSFKIYDRWGEEVYYSKTDISWDGTFNGQKIAQGVYVYVIEYTDSQGKSQVIAGDLTVVR